jgi:hypothetical protein
LNDTQLATTIADGSTYNLYIPSSSGRVGFTSDVTNSSVITSGFGSYGPVVYFNKNSLMSTDWSAVPTNETNFYRLEWASVDDEAIPVSLRSVAPSD